LFANQKEQTKIELGPHTHRHNSIEDITTSHTETFKIKIVRKTQ